LEREEVIVTRARLSPVLAILFSLCAGAASAKQDDGLLEHLSGPGPFIRFPAFEYRVACFARVDGKVYTSWMRPWERGAGFEFARVTPKAGTTADERAHETCAKDERVLGYVSVAYGHYFSLENNLFPDHFTDDVFKVKAESASVRYMARVLNAVDVGFGANVFWFHGKAFESFTKVSLEPVRVSVAPFAMLTESPRARAVHVTAAPTILLGRIVGQDFCNTPACTVTPRPFSSRAETIWATGLSVDLITLVTGK
jgi:hypothetical protein